MCTFIIIESKRIVTWTDTEVSVSLSLQLDAENVEENEASRQSPVVDAEEIASEDAAADGGGRPAGETERREAPEREEPPAERDAPIATDDRGTDVLLLFGFQSRTAPGNRGFG